MALTAYSLITIYARQVTTKALSTPVDVVQLGKLQSYSSGTGPYQTRIIYTRTGTLAPSSAITLNLKNGSLTDGLGQSLQFSAIKFLYLQSLTTKLGANLSLATFGSPNSHAHYGWSPGPIYIGRGGHMFMDYPILGSVLGSAGTWVRLHAYYLVTVNYKLVIAGT